MTITNPQSHHFRNPAEDLELDHFASLIGLRLNCFAGSGSILSNFKYPKLRHFHIEFDRLGFEEEKLKRDYRSDGGRRFRRIFIRSFAGLETLAIDVSDQRNPASLCRTW